MLLVFIVGNKEVGNRSIYLVSTINYKSSSIKYMSSSLLSSSKLIRTLGFITLIYIIGTIGFRD